MSWFKQMSCSDPTAEVSGQDERGINDAIYGTSDAILGATETRTTSLPGVPGPARWMRQSADSWRSQSILLQRSV